jgi:ferritin-like metal-binding protein YciE
MTASWFSKMLGASMTLDNLDKVLALQIADLISAEDQLISALPNMASAASSPELKECFQQHLVETRNQRRRLDQVTRMLGISVPNETCEAMQGLISEGEEVIGLDGDPDVKDAALIAAAQRVEHYEIAGYGCARSFARRLGLKEIVSLLQETLNEEEEADKKLTEIAESYINEDAAVS